MLVQRSSSRALSLREVVLRTRGSVAATMVLALALLNILLTGPAVADSSPIKPIEVGMSPWDIVVSNGGSEALVSTATAVEVIDLVSGSVSSRTVLARPRELTVSPQDGIAAAIIEANGFAIALFDFNNSTVLRQVKFPGWLQDIQFSADGTELFAATGAFGEFGTVHRLDAATLEVKSSLAVREEPTDLTIGPDGSTLYISCTGTDGVLAWDTGTADQVQTIVTRPGPKSIAFSPNGQLGYVTYAYNPGISVVDLDTHTVVEELVMPRTFYANNSAVNPRSGQFYLAGILVGFSSVDIAKGRIEADIRFDKGFVQGVAITPDGQQALTLVDGANGIYAAGEVQVLNLPLKVPSQPRNVKVRIQGSSGIVEWRPPKRRGTSNIQRYRVRISPGKLECTTKSTKCRIKGLRQATTYSITVQAQNPVGWGEKAAARGYSPRSVAARAIEDSQPVPGKPTQILW